MRNRIYTAVAGCFMVFFLFIAGCSQESKPAMSSMVIADDEKDPAVWGRKYPNQYDSYMQNEQRSTGFSKYRTAAQCRLTPWPFQFVLYDGWGFGKEYNDPNGHTEMMRDQQKIDPSRKKAGGVCLTCKTPYAPELRERLKIEYFQRPYEEVLKEIPEKHRQMGVICADCHDPATMSLRINRITLIESLKAIGKDPDKLTRQELRSLVCAQCHVDYSIPKDSEGKSSGLLFPWKNGKWGDIKIEHVIQQIKDDNLLEWKHKITGQKMGHLRHPEFELYSSPGSVHWAAGVACADCHMPYERVGREKISSHRWDSPVRRGMRACTQCHPQGADWLKEQVLNIQDRVNHMFTKAGYIIAQAALMIEAADKLPGVDQGLMKRAKELYQEAYYRNVWIGAENSMGFHNPPEALRVLGDAVDYGRQAESSAKEAIIKTGGSPPELDTAKIDQYVAQTYKTTDGKTGFKPDIQRKAALLVQ
ncbi:MAG: ammonia-forming cytochrome c nitrite reductase subunit c552 [Nitrospirae bacterium]|nr:ammonia-forming cytochrome c nitrite reductase subunit c552 [Nitrospirota bacterium]